MVYGMSDQANDTYLNFPNKPEDVIRVCLSYDVTVYCNRDDFVMDASLR